MLVFVNVILLIILLTKIFLICFSPDEFERRIDSELAALDSLPTEDNTLNRCSVISEDLLEFSDNLIDCDCAESQKNKSDSENRQSPVVDFQKKFNTESEISTSKFVQENIDISSFSKNLTSTRSSRPERSTARIKQEYPSLNFSHKSLASLIKPHVLATRESLTSAFSPFNVDSTSKVQPLSQGKDSSLTTSSGDDSQSKTEKYLLRQSDHVSCEDLLDFAYDRPNATRTRGPQNGEQSDEVRVMLKILRDQSTPESCVAALNVTNWKVHDAIKLERLQGLLKKENSFVRLEDCKVMLNQCEGDIIKAASLLRNTEDTAAV